MFQGGFVRKYLGVLAAVAALFVTSWAQAPAQGQPPDQAPAAAPAQAQEQTPGQTPAETPTPQAIPLPPTAPPKAQTPAIKYPRLELFAGGSYAEAGLFNAGHWAGLPGWDASFGLNITHWVGIVVDGGQYFGTSKIPVAVPKPFPTCGGNPSFCPAGTDTFDVTTREFNILFGLQFARRKYETWTPIAEIMYGHQGTRGEATAQGETFKEVSSGRALVAGAGIDRKISERCALRFKADYLQTGSFKLKQDNFRFSVGVVIRNVHKQRRKLEDETQVEP
jgi:hypothetical protein